MITKVETGCTNEERNITWGLTIQSHVGIIIAIYYLNKYNSKSNSNSNSNN